MSTVNTFDQEIERIRLSLTTGTQSRNSYQIFVAYAKSPKWSVAANKTFCKEIEKFDEVVASVKKLNPAAVRIITSVGDEVDDSIIRVTDDTIEFIDNPPKPVEKTDTEQRKKEPDDFGGLGKVVQELQIGQITSDFKSEIRFLNQEHQHAVEKLEKEIEDLKKIVTEKEAECSDYAEELEQLQELNDELTKELEKKNSELSKGLTLAGVQLAGKALKIPPDELNGIMDHLGASGNSLPAHENAGGLEMETIPEDRKPYIEKLKTYMIEMEDDDFIKFVNHLTSITNTPGLLEAMQKATENFVSNNDNTKTE
ncbi:hypothetical protein SDC9_53745 [bioreactor metagenome]|uniref:Uncharacterized protein n=1 Tax=bioreactor metagenome TaxID=1076179 RepID=A0A644WUK9_9ZZZZ